MTDITERDLTYSDFYKNLDGMTALSVASATPLRRLPDERDTAFVKRIVATYLSIAAQNGVHDPVGGTITPSAPGASTLARRPRE